jgi:prepilin-type N-terminal cleavage/methylation domain-containing protein
MASPRHPHRGFTLVELLVTIAVTLVLLMIAVPSFIALRQRATLQGVGEQVFGVWQQARLEAAKRNSLVKFGYAEDSGHYCVGAATTTDPNDTTPCDCTTFGACNVAAFPGEDQDWHQVMVIGTLLGQNTGVVVIDPKRTMLTDPADAGTFTMLGPPGQYSYRLNFLVDGMGRAVLCESTTATHKMPAYINTRCAP